MTFDRDTAVSDTRVSNIAAPQTSIALSDAELDTVNGGGLGTKILGVAITTGGALATVAGVATRQWGLASRGCNMIVDGIGHLEAA